MREYAFLVQTSELPGEATSEEHRTRIIAESLAALCEPLQRSLHSLDNGGWHAVSHHVLQTNGSLVVSFLISRGQREDS